MSAQVSEKDGRDHEFIDLLLPKVWEEVLDATNPEAIAEILNGKDWLRQIEEELVR